MFITFEGIEGSGKTTLLQGIASRLRASKQNLLVTREPGGTAAGNAIRKVFLEAGLRIDPLTEAFLVNASRAQLVSEEIDPALSAGRLVLCDRYVDSTLAYQGYGRGMDLAILRDLCGAATGGLNPDLTFLVDIDVTTSRARVTSRANTVDRVEAADLDFHERVRAGFLSLAQAEPNRIVVLDGERTREQLVDDAVARLGR
ncbi:MAG: dTMP kinase [Candidatus Eremiobacteraeota bacterium]|nr:dTMP kinase [Candidatus Eremiobacteraeota bacterium]